MKTPCLILLVLALPACGSGFGRAGDLSPLTGQTRAVLPMVDQPAWYRPLAEPGITLNGGPETASAAHDAASKRIWIGSRSQGFLCLNEVSGAVLWQVSLPGGTRGEAIYHADKVFFGTEAGEMVALDANTGEVSWRYAVQTSIRKQPKIFGDLLIFVDGSSTVFAVKHQTGEWQWQYRREPPKHFAVAGEGGVLLEDGKAFVGFSDGQVVALNASDGTVAWTRRLAPKAAQFTDVDSTPVFSNGLIYSGAVIGALTALDPSTGRVQWQKNFGGTLRLVGHAGDVIVIQDSGDVFKVDTYQRKIAWRTHVGAGLGSPSQPIIRDDTLFISYGRGGMIWLDARSGRPLSQFSPGGGVSARPLVTPHGVFVLGNEGTFFAFRQDQHRRTLDRTPLVDP